MLFGVMALMWHDGDTWQTLRWIWTLPLGAAVGGCLMVFQVAGGIGIQFRRTVRWASIVLALVYLLFSLACVPAIFGAPAAYEHYGSFFEQFALLCGSAALYGATEANAANALAIGRLARFGLGVCAVSFALSQIFYFRFTASLVPSWIPPNQKFWAILTTIAFALAAIAILSNREFRLALRLMTAMLVLFGVLVWIPRLVAHPDAHGNWSEFALTFLIAGAVWMGSDLKSF